MWNAQNTYSPKSFWDPKISYQKALFSSIPSANSVSEIKKLKCKTVSVLNDVEALLCWNETSASNTSLTLSYSDSNNVYVLRDDLMIIDDQPLNSVSSENF